MSRSMSSISGRPAPTTTSIDVWKDNRLQKCSAEQLFEWTPKGTCAVFLSSKAVAEENLRPRLSKKFSVPSVFWVAVSQDANGFFGSQDYFDENEVIRASCTWFKFLIKDLSTFHRGSIAYFWHHLLFFTYCTPQSNCVLCFDVPEALQSRLVKQFSTPDDMAISLTQYSLHPIIIREVIAIFDTSVWGCRNIVRDIEKNRDKPIVTAEYLTSLHEVARHIIHSLESLTMGTQSLSAMINQIEIVQFPPQDIETRKSKQIKKSLQFQASLLEGILGRSKALESRLSNEISLAFNLLAQHENKISADIGRAAQRDSGAMKTISVMTLIFLPGTFISALFGMSFFDFTAATDTEPASWSMATEFWIYWVVAIPVTAATVISWLVWNRGYMAKFEGANRSVYSEVERARTERKKSFMGSV